MRQARKAGEGPEILKGACDCHVHVFGPHSRFALSKDRKYTPPEAPVEALLRLQGALELERVVIVQPSPYGTDNSCTLEALRSLGSRARGVAVIHDNISKTELKKMHASGIRGIRVNLETGGERDPAAARRAIEAAATVAESLGWHVQVYTSLPVLSFLHDAILELETILVVDHFGLPKGEEGLGSLLDLVRRGKAYVKLSAPHRFAREPDCADAGPLARALAEANPDRLLWGSDWPHPAVKRGGGPERVQPFDAIDDARALARLAEWLPDSNLLEKILVANPARLYDF